MDHFDEQVEQVQCFVSLYCNSAKIDVKERPRHICTGVTLTSPTSAPGVPFLQTRAILLRCACAGQRTTRRAGFGPSVCVCV